MEVRFPGEHPDALEEIVKEKFNPYGHTDVKDSVAYVRMLRRRSRGRSDQGFLKDIREEDIREGQSAPS